MDLATFRQRTLDFKKTDPGVVEGALAAAALELDPVTWGKLYDEGVFWLTQFKLAQSEFGRATRKEGSAEDYGKEFERLQTIVAAGACMVSGGGILGPFGPPGCR